MLRRKFKITQTVYLKTDPESLPRMITRYTVSAKDITYELSYNGGATWHYDFEITDNIKEPKHIIGLGKGNRN